MNPKGGLSDAQVQMMREYRRGGWAYKDLGALFGRSENRCSEICRGLGYKKAPGPIEGRGTKSYNHNVTYNETGASQEAELVRRLAARGHSQRAIADHIGRSKTHVANILNKRNRY
jgi:hypothetical protein